MNNNRRFDNDRYESRHSYFQDDLGRMSTGSPEYSSDYDYDLRDERRQDRFMTPRDRSYSLENRNYGLDSDMNEYNREDRFEQRSQRDQRPEWERQARSSYSADNYQDRDWQAPRYRSSYSSSSSDQDQFARRDSYRPMNQSYSASSQQQQQQHTPGVIEAVKNFFGKGPKGYKRSDERIKEEVSEVLYRHPRIDASDIEVDVKDGNVTLMGAVESREMKRLTEDVVEECLGVVNVTNHLRVGSSSLMGSAPLNRDSSTSVSGKKDKSLQ